MKKAGVTDKKLAAKIRKSNRYGKPKSPLNAKVSKRNRDRAIERAERHAGDWLGEAYKAARGVAEKFRFFTTDDVWKAGLSKPDEPRALGPVMLSLERDGIIAATDKFKNTAQKTRNAAPVRLWRSCVYMGK
jgi:hypothetical protein